jgi:hypothetical protein
VQCLFQHTEPQSIVAVPVPRLLLNTGSDFRPALIMADPGLLSKREFRYKTTIKTMFYHENYANMHLITVTGTSVPDPEP